MPIKSEKMKTDSDEQKYCRLQVSYKNVSEKFKLESQDYSKQFAHMYAHRLSEKSKLLEEKAKRKWGTEVPVKKLCELREETSEKCIIVGTLFKHQTYKPSILREISEENQLAPQPTRQHYVGSTDKLILEDELQRIRLVGKIDINFITTGVVCAVLGHVESDGKLNVEEFVFYESGPQKPMSSLDISPLVVFISGLDQTSHYDYASSLDLLQHWLCGNINRSKDQKDWDAANVVRVIIAGNSARASPELKPPANQSRKPEAFGTLQAMKELDQWFSSWSQSVPLDVMPGEFDPSNFMMPQQAFHRCMFPQSNRNAAFSSVPNPYACEISGRSILGTSGQNVHDIMKTTNIEDPLEALRSTLIWSHIAPTCPDTLPCYPYVSEDPFIIYECPFVYFVGNTDAFKTDFHQGSDGQKNPIGLRSVIR